MMDSVIQFEGTIYEDGYGLLAQKVMRDKTLPKQSKLIYAYMCSFAGINKTGERTAFPSVSLQCAELGMTQDTYYKWRKPLVEKGYIKITSQLQEGAKFDNNIYSIVAVPVEIKEKEKPENKEVKPTPKKSGMEKKPYPNFSSTENPSTEKQGTNSNSFNSNSFNSNSFKKEEEEKASLQLDSSVKEYLTNELKYDSALIQEIAAQITTFGITSFTKTEIVDQHDFMVEQNKVKRIGDWAFYFVNGITMKRNNPKNKVVGDNKKKRTGSTKKVIRTEMVPEWMNKEEQSNSKEEIKTPVISEERKKTIWEQIKKLKTNN